MNYKKKLKIFLADLAYDQQVDYVTVPLNIGYIAATLKEEFKDTIDLELFKFPTNLIKALKGKPDVIGFSNYMWNINLNRAVISIAREINPNVLIVMGGPNIRKSKAGVERFLLRRSDIDIYVVNEGEYGFRGLVEYVLSIWPCNLKENIVNSKVRIPNNAYLSTESGSLIIGKQCDTFKEKRLHFPSAWLSGVLDSFLKSTFPIVSPIIETNRGCPYQCVYCTWGTFEDKKVRKFDLDIVFEELRYIFSKATHAFHLMIVDANFGIFERDVSIAEEIRRLADKHKNMSRLHVMLGKSNLKRNIEIINILQKYSIPDFAVQTMNNEVDKNIGRKSIKHESIANFVDTINEQGLRVYTDLLVGLPGETIESHVASLKKAIDIGFYKTTIGDIKIFEGSRIEEDDYMAKYDIETSVRVMPKHYGEYNGIRVVEYEKCIRKTDVISEEDFRQLRIVRSYVFILYQVGIGRPLFEFAHRHGLHPIDLIFYMSLKMPVKETILSKQIDYFINHANAEWFKTEDDANAYYLKDENFKILLIEGFPKLNYEYAAKLILDLSLRNEYLKWIEDNIKEKLDNVEDSVVEDITRFSFYQTGSWMDGFRDDFMELAPESFAELRNNVSVENTNKLIKGEVVRVKFYFEEMKRKVLSNRLCDYKDPDSCLDSVMVTLEFDSFSFIRKCVVQK